MIIACFAPEEQHVYSNVIIVFAPAERHVLETHIALRLERKSLRARAVYKHVAPPEQEELRQLGTTVDCFPFRKRSHPDLKVGVNERKSYKGEFIRSRAD